LPLQTDLTAPAAADEIAKATLARFGRIDILVNNAGIGPGAIRPDSWQRPLKFWEITPEEWLRFVAVHTTAPLALTNAVVPEMMRRGWGRIVNVTTSLGTMLNAGYPTYGPSKAALEALSAIMAKDLDGSGVTVNVLVPVGVTNTPMISDAAGFERDKLIQLKSWRRRSSGSSPKRPRRSPAAAFSRPIGIRHCRRRKPPREPARRSPGAESRRCRSRRAVPERGLAGRRLPRRRRAAI
jgi:NAD(P)-dependent dehydrogenase (short-subunit alcohol dehydrogenase family)